MSAFRFFNSFSLSLIFCFIIAFDSTSAQASFTDCKTQFYKYEPPKRIKTTHKDITLCFHGFATRYSSKHKIAMWSAERLTSSRLTKAEDIPRKNSFHSEMRIPELSRAKLKDYVRSGYDRGHLAPSADMATYKQQYDSFSLVNIIPQSPHLNRNIWKKTESAVRHLTKIHKESYVITGVVFDVNSETIGNSVTIPSYVYKVVYIPSSNQLGVYLAPNDESGRIQSITIHELNQLTGFDLMPALNDRVVTLPLPDKVFDQRNTAEKDNRSSSNSKSTEGWWIKLIVAILSWFLEQIQQS